MAGPTAGNPASFEGRTPRCRRCFYILDGLKAGSCPECGRPFDPSDPVTVTYRVPFVRWKFWLPSLVLGTVAGGLLIVLLASFGYTGTGLWIGVPLALGTFIGYGGRTGILATVCLALTVVGAVLLTLTSLSLAGIYCALILAGIFFGPLLLGALSGLALRHSLRHAPWFEQRDWLVRLLILSVPVLWSLIEGRPANTLPIEIVRTSEVIPVTPASAWDALMTYEEVSHPPPALLRLGLPTPLRVNGSLRAVGDTRRCEYSEGYLVKRVVESTHATALTFDVVEQTIDTHGAATLIDGSFLFEPNGNGATITLTTRYRPHLAPRFVWRPAEALVVHTLHRHVIEGMRLKAETDAHPALARRTP